jgi:hypothetical protein
LAYSETDAAGYTKSQIPQYSSASYPAVGASAPGAGTGLNTALYTATSTFQHSNTTSRPTVIQTFSNVSTTYTTTSTGSVTSSGSTSTATGEYTDWSVFVANGVNLGGWLEVETSNNPEVFQTAPAAADEWTMCEILGRDACGVILEDRYATHIAEADIDRLAAVGKSHIWNTI